MTGLEIVGDLLNRPTTEATARIVGDVGGKPALQRVALQPLAGLVAAENGLRRVTEAAMAEALGQIGAAIPLGALVRIRHKCPGREVQPIPHPHGRANVERKRQLIWLDRILHGRNGVEIGADRQRVVARHLGVIGVGHGRIEVPAIATGALGHRVDELVVGPGADAGRRIGRDVRRQDDAERRFDRAPAGKVVAAARQRMAGRAIADDRQIAAALDLLEILLVDAVGQHAAGRHRQQQRAQHAGE